jgi:hypothetical protein
VIGQFGDFRDGVPSEPVKLYPDEQPASEEAIKTYGFGLPVFPMEHRWQAVGKHADTHLR